MSTRVIASNPIIATQTQLQTPIVPVTTPLTLSTLPLTGTPLNTSLTSPTLLTPLSLPLVGTRPPSPLVTTGLANTRLSRSTIVPITDVTPLTTVARPPSPRIVTTRPPSPRIVTTSSPSPVATANQVSMIVTCPPSPVTNVSSVITKIPTEAITASRANTANITPVRSTASTASTASTSPAMLTPGALVPVLGITTAAGRPPSPLPTPLSTVGRTPTLLSTVGRPPSPLPVPLSPLPTPLITAGRPRPVSQQDITIMPTAALPSANLFATPISPVATRVPITSVGNVPTQIFSRVTPMASAAATSVSTLPASPMRVQSMTGTSPIQSMTASATYQSLIATVGLEGELLGVRYQIEGTISLNNGRSENRVQYIKAVNANGQKVYIMVDVTGVLPTKRNLVMIPLTGPARVHHSTKLNAYDCVKNSVAGVAFEVGVDGLSTIVRDSETLEPREANYALIDQTQELENKGIVMTYPIVRMSEIRTNPQLVLENTNEAFSCLRLTTTDSHSEAIRQSFEDLKALSEAWVYFNEIRYKVAGTLIRDIDQLQNWNNIFNERTVTSDTERDKVNGIQRNLAIRNERFEDISRLTRRVINRTAEIQAIAADISAITAAIEWNNRDLGTIL